MVNLLAWWISGAQASVVINEFLPNPDGADGGFEWIEIYNTGPVAVDLEGWTIEKATSIFSTTHTFGVVSIPVDGYVLIGEASVPDVTETATLAMGNAGSSGDAIRLLDAADAVQDTVVYGSDNTDAFLNDAGVLAVSFAPVASGASGARNPNGADTDASGTDFFLANTPSPGADNNSTVPSCDPAAGSGLKINELLPDPAGTDTDMEWVEFYNAGSAIIDVSGWAIASGTSTFSAVGVLPDSTTVAPGEFLFVGQNSASNPDVVAPGFTLGNAGSNSDAVQLRDCLGGIADTVVYGPNNTDGWLNDAGTVANPSPKPGGGESIGRLVDGADTDDSGVDFGVLTIPNPGDTNEGGVVGPIDCDEAAGSGVVINELVSDPPGADAGNEWIEITNNGSATVDISGWGIAAGTSSFGSVGALPDALSLAPGQFFVIGQSALTAPNAIATFSLGNASSSADGVQLRDCGGAVADTVIYGQDNPDDWIDDTGALASLAPRPGSGESIGRIPDGVDTNLSAGDFVVLQPTRGISNTATPPDCGGFGAGLVINEFLTNPAGQDAGFEWVELFHGGSAILDLEGWAVESAGGDNWSARFTFEPGETIAPGEFFLIGGEFVDEATHPMTGTLGNGSNGDGLRVVDCTGTPSDVVVYGGNNDDGVPDETGNPANTVAPTPPEDGSVQRVIDGRDTGANNLDFAVSEQPTPGTSNIEITPIECEASKGGIRINELLPDPEGADAGLEWFELYNAGNEPQDLDGWAFSAGTADFDDRDIVLPGGTSIRPGEWLLIGGDLVDPPVDLVLDFSLGNGSSSRDGLRMFDCEGAAIDTVIYGALNEEESEPGVVDDLGQLAPSYGDPSGIQSLLRVEDGIDTNSADDWAVGRASPGETNMIDVGPPNPTTGGCGCGGGPNDQAPGGGPNGDAPNGSGCNTVPAQSLAFSLALCIAFRRRRAIG